MFLNYGCSLFFIADNTKIASWYNTEMRLVNKYALKMEEVIRVHTKCYRMVAKGNKKNKWINHGEPTLSELQVLTSALEKMLQKWMGTLRLRSPEKRRLRARLFQPLSTCTSSPTKAKVTRESFWKAASRKIRTETAFAAVKTNATKNQTPRRICVLEMGGLKTPQMEKSFQTSHRTAKAFQITMHAPLY